MKYKLQIDAPIIPNESLGGFALRTPLIDIQNQIEILGGTMIGNYNLATPFGACYLVGDKLMEIGVDVRNGKIYNITACSGYRGRLLDKIIIGMKVKEVSALIPSIYYDESRDILQSNEYPGLAMNVGETDPPLHLLPDMKITSISVYANEITTFDGSKGLW